MATKNVQISGKRRSGTRGRTAVGTAVMLLAVVCLWPGEAFAYLDPGTGSALLQLVVAGVMGSIFLMKTYWYKILAFFSKSDDTDGTPQELADDDERAGS